MAHRKTHAKTAEPVIRFGGEWIPAHDLWEKMATTNAIANVIERFNKEFPHLSSSHSRDVVPLVRQRLKDIDLRMPDEDAQPDLGEVVIGLLESMSPEQAITILRDQYDTEMDIGELMNLAGEEAYVSALLREARKYSVNQISPEQTAELWNDAGRPTPGGGLWTAKKVQDLLDQAG